MVVVLVGNLVPLEHTTTFPLFIRVIQNPVGYKSQRSYLCASCVADAEPCVAHQETLEPYLLTRSLVCQLLPLFVHSRLSVGSSIDFGLRHESGDKSKLLGSNMPELVLVKGLESFPMLRLDTVSDRRCRYSSLSLSLSILLLSSACL